MRQKNPYHCPNLRIFSIPQIFYPYITRQRRIKNHKKSFDLRDLNFNSSSVTQDDVIHASKKDIDLIFKVCGTGIHRTTSVQSQVVYQELLIKAQTTADRKKVKGIPTKTYSLTTWK